MKLIRKILVKILGLKGYLRLVSRTYIFMVSNGLMKNKYRELFFIKQAISKGDTVVDIGANLAYYSNFMAKQIGEQGKLIAVEPIPLFADIWMKNMWRHRKLPVQLVNCALGSENQEKIKMSIPIVNGVVRHGLTKVDDQGQAGESYISYEVTMKIGDEVLKMAGIDRLDYIKCDVEGFEQFVIPSMDENIKSFKPMFQIELSGKENRQNVVDYLVNLCYDIYILEGQLLRPIQKSDIFSFEQDFYFIHQDKKEARKDLIQN